VRRTALIASLLFVLTAACQDKAKAPAPAPTGPVAPAGGSAAPAPTAGPLPKTHAPLDEAVVKKLAALTIPGDKPKVNTSSAKELDVMHLSVARPQVAVWFNVKPCTACIEPDLAKWRAQTDQLKAFFPPVIRDLPSSIFEVGAATVAETPMIYTYQVGYASSTKGATYSHAYVLYYNDGVNTFRVMAEFKDDWPRDQETMVNLIPRAELERQAAEAMTTYVRAF
jgi:hypothetical protein